MSKNWFPTIEEFEAKCRDNWLSETEIREKVQAYCNLILWIIDWEKCQSDNMKA